MTVHPMGTTLDAPTEVSQDDEAAIPRQFVSAVDRYARGGTERLALQLICRMFSAARGTIEVIPGDGVAKGRSFEWHTTFANQSGSMACMAAVTPADAAIR